MLSISEFSRMCRGCTIECNDDVQNLSSGYIAIDWDLKEMHLRYQSSHERVGLVRIMDIMYCSYSFLVCCWSLGSQGSFEH